MVARRAGTLAPPVHRRRVGRSTGCHRLVETEGVTASAAPQYRFTVFTPTYNRAHTLTRVYESLKAQTFSDFEWLIVDDGSTDETRTLVESWRAESETMPIRYFYQPNAGKHVADNRSVREARGEFCATLDSDDWYLPDALETFHTVWETIDPAERDSFVGIVGLCAAPGGAVIGSLFPQDPIDTTYAELTHNGVVGDKAGMGRTVVLRRFPFPVVPGEKLIIEELVYTRIAREFRIRCVNTIVKIAEYQPAGLSATTGDAFRANPRTASAFFLQQLREPGRPALRARTRAQAQHIRYALHAGQARQSLRETPSKPLWALMLPISLLLWARDRTRANDR